MPLQDSPIPNDSKENQIPVKSRGVPARARAFLVGFVVAILAIGVYRGLAPKQAQEPELNNANITNSGQAPVTNTPALDQGATKSDLIVLDSPARNSLITSPLRLSGKARGTWYFEASFPIVLVDWDGKIIAESHAQAQGEWMTEDFVPFEEKVIFTSPYKMGDPDFMKRGTLILKKDNPSGLPEHDDALEIPIRFAEK